MPVAQLVELAAVAVLAAFRGQLHGKTSADEAVVAGGVTAGGVTAGDAGGAAAATRAAPPPGVRRRGAFSALGSGAGGVPGAATTRGCCCARLGAPPSSARIGTARTRRGFSRRSRGSGSGAIRRLRRAQLQMRAEEPPAPHRAARQPEAARRQGWHGQRPRGCVHGSGVRRRRRRRSHDGVCSPTMVIGTDATGRGVGGAEGCQLFHSEALSPRARRSQRPEFADHALAHRPGRGAAVRSSGCSSRGATRSGSRAVCERDCRTSCPDWASLRRPGFAGRSC